MIRRRSFILEGGAALGALALAPHRALAMQLELAAGLPDALARRADGGVPAALAEDEAFWAEVRTAYDLDPDVVNLDHG